MNIIVVYPGRFHTFNLGPKASYYWLIDKFCKGVYIATSNVQNDTDSPFSYADKVKMMTRLGIQASHVVQTRNPYQVKEITDNLTSEEQGSTALVFAVSAKDAERFNFKPKKNGEPSYLQPLPENLGQLKPMSQQGYVTITPTVNFKVKGVDADSASQVRKLYSDANDEDRVNIITDLYGAPDAELKSVFDERLASKTEEIITYGTPIISGGEQEVGIMHENRQQRLQQLQEEIRQIKQQIQTRLDYADEKNSR